MLLKLNKQVISWNRARYEQVYVHDLQKALIAEELSEYHEATEEVDKLDALCDLCYVAMGALWKLDQDLKDCLITMPNAKDKRLDVAAQLAMEDSNHAKNLMGLIEICLHTAESTLSLDYYSFCKALQIVCDANDTKVVIKCEADKKANGGNKGPNFVSPEAKLQELLDARLG